METQIEFLTRFRGIQSLRAGAAIGVVVFHLAPSNFQVGAAGVDAFFVISGFIMGTICRHETPGNFLIKRLARIIPLYWAITLAMCLGSLIPGVFQRFSFDFGSLIKSLTFVPYLDPTGHIWPLVVSGWTLNYEVLFYIAIVLGVRTGRPIAVPIALLSLLVAAGYAAAPKSAALQTWTNPLLLEFLAGLVLSQASFVRGVFIGVTLVAAGTTGFFTLALAPIIQCPRILLWGLPALAIVSGVVAIERAAWWPKLPVLETLGDASYSLYLLHGIVIDIGHKLLSPGNILTGPIIIIASVLLALCSCRLFERPIARLVLKAAPTWLRTKPEDVTRVKLQSPAWRNTRIS